MGSCLNQDDTAWSSCDKRAVGRMDLSEVGTGHHRSYAHRPAESFLLGRLLTHLGSGRLHYAGHAIKTSLIANLVLRGLVISACDVVRDVGL